MARFRMLDGLDERLRLLRAKKNVSGRVVAESLHVHKSTIAAWERGERSVPDHMIVKLAEYYNVSTDFLLGLEARKAIFIDELPDYQVNMVQSVIQTLHTANLAHGIVKEDK